MEIILDVNVSQLTERQKGMFIRQIGVLLGVLDSDITVQKIQPYTEQRWGSSGRVHGRELLEGLENQGLISLGEQIGPSERVELLLNIDIPARIRVTKQVLNIFPLSTWCIVLEKGCCCCLFISNL